MKSFSHTCRRLPIPATAPRAGFVVAAAADAAAIVERLAAAPAAVKGRRSIMVLEGVRTYVRTIDALDERM